MLRYPSGRTDPVRHCCEDFYLFIDRVHALFEEMEDALRLSPHDASLQHAKLVVHEWLANLVQHADFEGRRPEISLEITLRGSKVQITIRDNSEGFDLDLQLQAQQEALAPFPDHGLGLLAIQACTEGLSYSRVAQDQHCLAFSVSAGQRPVLALPLSPLPQPFVSGTSAAS